MANHHLWIKRIPLILLAFFIVITTWILTQWTSMPVLWGGIIGLNILSAFTFAYDKFVAGRGVTRIPERVLLTLCLVGGSMGGGLIMFGLRHKTSKTAFVRLFAGIVILQVLALLSVFLLRGN